MEALGEAEVGGVGVRGPKKVIHSRVQVRGNSLKDLLEAHDIYVVLTSLRIPRALRTTGCSALYRHLGGRQDGVELLGLYAMRHDAQHVEAVQQIIRRDPSPGVLRAGRAGDEEREQVRLQLVPRARFLRVEHALPPRAMRQKERHVLHACEAWKTGAHHVKEAIRVRAQGQVLERRDELIGGIEPLALGRALLIVCEQ